MFLANLGRSRNTTVFLFFGDGDNPSEIHVRLCNKITALLCNRSIGNVFFGRSRTHVLLASQNSYLITNVLTWVLTFCLEEVNIDMYYVRDIESDVGRWRI